MRLSNGDRQFALDEFARPMTILFVWGNAILPALTDCCECAKLDLALASRAIWPATVCTPLRQRWRNLQKT